MNTKILELQNYNLKIKRRNLFFFVIVTLVMSIASMTAVAFSNAAVKRNQAILQTVLEQNGTISQITALGKMKSDTIIEVNVDRANCIIHDANREAVALVKDARQNAETIKAKRLNISSGRSKLSFPIDITDSERNLLYHLVQGESGNQCDQGQIAVCWVVLNRMADPRYPSTITGVIYQKNPVQFSCTVGDGFYTQPSFGVKQNVDAVLAGKTYDPTSGAEAFCNPTISKHMSYFNSLVKSVRIGGHQFYFV